MNKLPLYCSTGTIIGRLNGYNHKYILDVMPEIVEEAGLDGIELMMLPAFYDNLPAIVRDLTASELKFPVIHSDKNIGILMSQGGKEDIEESIRLFDLNCKTGIEIGAKKLVLHLWGGPLSDSHIETHIDLCPILFEIADKYNIEIVFENIPCSTHTPLENLKNIYSRYPRAKTLFDTRFGAFHHQFDALYNSDWMWNGSLCHIHISELRDGAERDFARLRPILHPGEGHIDFIEFFDKIKAHGYKDSVTLESPVLSEDGIDRKKLLSSLLYIKDAVNK